MINPKKHFMKLKEKIFKKKKEESRTILEKFTGIMKFINIMARVAGLQFTEDWKSNGRQLVAVFLNLVTLLSCIYSIWYMLPEEDAVMATGGIAFNLLVWIKLIVVSFNHEKFMSLVRFLWKVYEINQTGQRASFLITVTKTINYHLEIKLGSFLAGYAFYSALPFYDYIVKRTLTLVSPMLLPFVDANQLLGYFITTVFNVFIVSYCLTICIAVSSLFFASVDTYDGLVSFVESDFGTYDLMCEKKDEKEHDALFRNIIMELSDLARLSHYMNDLFSVISTGQISMSFLVVACSVAAYLAMNFKGGLGSGLVFYTGMLMYCYIGQILDNTNDRIINVICNAKWYYYKVKYQKDMMIALYIAQNMQSIRLANVCPLNFNTGLQISKNIYTLSMFMLEIFD